MTTEQGNASARVLVVDDEPDLRTLYELTLLREGYQVATAESLAQARRELKKAQFDVLITDMRLPDGDGLSLMRELAGGARRERCIMITAYGSPESAVEALKIGAFDYLTKPVDLRQFRAVVRSALQAPEAVSVSAPLPVTTASAPLAGARASTRHGSTALARLIGDSAVMRAVKKRITQVAPSMAPVLVFGESGTGKELVAQAVHACSHRSTGPFVPVNCGAIPDNLLEAEFFGALKGSYTGAAQDRLGFFQAAAGGTLFLDEIGELPLAMQAKLLRAIQERRVRPLGATQEEAVDVRIISATHKNLADEVLAGRFRQDLFYRLNVIEIAIAPLRERREDIPALCAVLLARIAQESGGPAIELTAEQQVVINAAPLAGNVRELENLLYRAAAMGTGRDSNLGALESITGQAVLGAPEDRITRPAIALSIPAELAPVATVPRRELAAWLDEQERAVLLEALGAAQSDLQDAAARLNLSARQLGYRMKRLGITAPGAAQHAAPTRA